MNMKLKSVLIVCIVLLLGVHLTATQTAIFLRNGTTVTDTIKDISSRTGQMDLAKSGRMHISQVWMFNYENTNWNFPDERNQLSPNRNLDTIFLRNGQVIHRELVDFSSRRFVFEFRNGGKVHESKIKRIYFRGVKMPGAYNNLLKKPKPRGGGGGGGNRGGGNRYAAVFMLDGKHIVNPLSYLNEGKTGFSDGLQINSKDIWMISHEDENWNYPNERRRLNKQTDTIFLKNGSVIQVNITEFDGKTGNYRLQNGTNVHESQVKRIYLCCYQLPDAYKNKGKTRRGVRGRR
ncbi:MAG: hypothetical protein GY940_36010 [bacterium]|nr:hypothetical protein [bacterium]